MACVGSQPQELSGEMWNRLPYTGRRRDGRKSRAAPRRWAAGVISADAYLQGMSSQREDEISALVSES